MELIISTTHNALFTPDSICEECDLPAAFFIDALNDEFCACLCAAHASHTASAIILDFNPAE